MSFDFVLMHINILAYEKYVFISKDMFKEEFFS